MLIVDVIAVVVLIGAFAGGLARGFFASLGTVVGTVLGAVAALWLLPLVTPWVATVVPEGVWRAAIGGAIGHVIRHGVDRVRLRAVERFFGGVLSLVAASLVLVLVGTGLAGAGIPQVSAAVASSRVIGALDALTPAPVEDALARARGAFLTDGLPRLEAVIGAVVAPTEPAIALDDPELQAAASSVARISGTAYA